MNLNLDIFFAALLFSVLLSEADGYFWSLFGAPIADQNPQQDPEAAGNQDTLASHPRNVFPPPPAIPMRDDPDSAAFQQLMPKVRRIFQGRVFILFHNFKTTERFVIRISYQSMLEFTSSFKLNVV